MKKHTYIAPELVTVELGTKNQLMNISIVGDRNVAVNNDGSNVGLVKEETYITDKSLWDNEW